MKEPIIYGHADNVFVIPVTAFQDLGIKALVCDLDQTLATVDEKEPSEQVRKLQASLKTLGISLIIISNNFPRRVDTFGKALGCPSLGLANKKSGRRIKRFLHSLSLTVDDCLFVGDQLETDGVYTRKLEGRFLLVKPLSPKDNWITRLLRERQNRRIRQLESDNRLGIDFNPVRKEPDNVLQ